MTSLRSISNGAGMAVVKQYLPYTVLLVSCAALAASFLFLRGRQSGAESLAEAERLLKRGQPELAVRLIEEAILSTPSAKAWRLNGEALASTGQYESARISYQNAADMEMDKVRKAADLLTAGECSLQLGDLALAESFYRASFSSDPVQTTAEVRLEWLLRVEGRLSESRVILARYMRTGTPTLEQLLNYGHPNRQRLLPESLLSFRDKLERDGLPMLALAQDALIAGQRPLALDYSRRVVDRFPQNLDAQICLGRLLLDEGIPEFSAWIGGLPESLRLEPDTWFLLGLAVERRQQPEAAAAAYRQVLAQDRFHEYANLQMAIVLTQLGFPNAAEPFRRVSEVQQQSELLLDDIHDNRNPEKAVAALVPLLMSVGRVDEAGHWIRLAESRIGSQSQFDAVRRKFVDGPSPEPALDLAGLVVDFGQFPLPDPGSLSSQHAPESGPPASAGAVAFQARSDDIGLTFRFDNADGQTVKRRMVQSNGGGIGVCDLDGDAWPDLFLTQGGRWPADPANPNPPDRVFRNRLGVRMSDITDIAVPVDGQFSQGVSVSDCDGDGFDDVFVCNVGTNRLLHNNGDGTLSDVTFRADVEGNEWTASAAFADWNGDSLEDLFVVNYLSLDDAAAEICHEEKRLRSCSSDGFLAAPDQLFLNAGDGQFEDISQDAGVLQRDGRGMGIVAANLDSDFQLDAFVSNDAVPNFLFLNKPEVHVSHGIHFAESAFTSGVAVDFAGRPQACMGIAAADFDHNGFTDLFVTNFLNEPNTLYLNQGAGLFVDRSESAGVAQPSLSFLGFGTQAVDLERDGDDDLMILNGHLDDMSADGVPYRMRPQVMRNLSGQGFHEVVAESGFLSTPHIGRALATLDWNRDGLVDAIAGMLEEPTVLLENTSDTQHHWLQLSLTGTTSARSAVGTSVTISPGNREMTRQLTSGSGFQASNERVLYWGIGEHDAPVDVRIRWPDGGEQVLRSVLPDSEYRIVQRPGDRAARHIPE